MNWRDRIRHDAIRWSERLHSFALLAVLSLLAGILVVAARDLSTTIDEPYHLVRGLAVWWTRTTTLSVPHPPLANAITSVYAAWTTQPVDFSAWAGWKQQSSTFIADEFFAHHPLERASPLIFYTRISMIAIALTWIACVWVVLRRRYGHVSAAGFLVLVSLSPTLLAHAHLNTTDFPSLVGVSALLFALTTYVERPSHATAIGVGATGGIAACIKHQMPLFIVAGVIMAVFLVSFSRAHSIRRLGLHVALMAAATILLINMLYGFRHTGLSVGEIIERPAPQVFYGGSISKENVVAKSPLRHLPQHLRIPLPYTYLAGLATITRQNRYGHPSYFMETLTRTGHPAYFPVLGAAKSPLTLWCLVLVAMGLFVRRISVLRLRRREGRPLRSVARDPMVVLAAWMATVGTAMLIGARLNLGIRHGLPVMGLITILAAITLQTTLHNRALRWVLACTIVADVVAATQSYPDFLGYFNAAIGRERGHRWSIVGEDWGQDVGAMVEELQSLAIARITYVNLPAPPVASEAFARLQAAGIQRARLPCNRKPKPETFVAVHRSRSLRAPQCFGWTNDALLVRRIHDHIDLYFMPPSATMSPTENGASQRRMNTREGF